MLTVCLTSLRQISMWLVYACLCLAPAVVPRVYAQDPTPNCGGHNEPACREHDRAKFWSHYGCPAGSFRDPRNGGECWSCPGGYPRTVRQVTSPKACAVRPLGPFRAATYHGKPLDCPAGTFRDIGRNECWSCDEGYRRTVTQVTSDKACIIEPGYVCDPGTQLKVTQDTCFSSAPDGIAEAAARARSEHTAEIALAQQLMNELGDDPAFTRALREDDQDAVLARLERSPNYQTLVSLKRAGVPSTSVAKVAASNEAQGSTETGAPDLTSIPVARPSEGLGFVVTLGVGIDASLLVGGNAEVGMVIGDSSECDSRVRGYITYGYSSGLSAGVDASFAYSIFNLDTIEEAAGDVQGFVMAASANAGAAITFWFTYGYDTAGRRPPEAPILGEFIGFTLAGAVGYSAEIGEYNRVRTKLFRPKRCN